MISISPHRVNWGNFLRSLLLAVLVLPLFGVVSAHNADASKVQPALLAMVAQHPNAKISIIVQKLAKDDSVERLVGQSGGTITKDLRDCLKTTKHEPTF